MISAKKNYLFCMLQSKPIVMWVQGTCIWRTKWTYNSPKTKGARNYSFTSYYWLIENMFGNAILKLI